jgi:hypothetical protein
LNAHADDNAATIWVCTLGPHQVTRPQKNVLLRIAAHWTNRYGLALAANAELCDQLQYCPRQLGRILRDLSDAGWIVYRPGQGSGNYSQFRFPRMPVENPVHIAKKGDVTPTETRHFRQANKGRKPEPKSTSKSNPPSPPSAKGGTLTRLEIQRLRRDLAWADRNTRNASPELLVRNACDRALIEFERAWPWVSELWGYNLDKFRQAEDEYVRTARYEGHKALDG